MIYACCSQRRRAAVLGNPALNGIDYLEVQPLKAVAKSPPQRTLLVHCLRPPPTDLTVANVLIQGGERITAVGVAWVAPAQTPPPSVSAAERAYLAAIPGAANVLVVRTAIAGDFSTYTLRLVADAAQAAEDPLAITSALAGFDPQLCAVDFSFKVECGPDFDCQPPAPDCPPQLPAPPPISYLAKDYGSLRTVLIDRLSQLLPAWAPGTEADLGVALAELLAYVGDRLSYRQDAIATEAYLGTARSRISLRRHALLVDYQVSEGCNARAWMQLQVAEAFVLAAQGTRFATAVDGFTASLAPGAGNEEAALVAGVTVFEPMQDAELRPEHNRLSFYTWGESDCCLPTGATEATLAGTYPHLQPGDVLIFEEVVGPQTGAAADADLRHRCAVRLTQVATRDGRGEPLCDPLYEQGTGLPITAPALQQPTPVTEIQWAAADALPFPLCLSATYHDASGQLQALSDVSVALGNVVLADHGLSFAGVALGTVPAPRLFYPPAGDRCQTGVGALARAPLPVRFRPALPDQPLSRVVGLPLVGSPVTPGVVMLSSSGAVSLTDAQGNTCLLIQAAAWTWPLSFGVLASFNAANPAHLDLAVVYDPSGGAAGVAAPVVLERLTDLSLNASDPDYIATAINQGSQLIRVPAGYVPPAGTPSGFSANPAMLSASGAVTMADSSGTAFLLVQPTPTAIWAANVGVVAQGNQQQPQQFNLLVLYDPPAGGVGVTVPITLESYQQVALDGVADLVNAESHLIQVTSFADAPAPSLTAAALIATDSSLAVPAISLVGTLDGLATAWLPQQDLLEEGPADATFVVEVDSDGSASLRFGDGVNGLVPASGTSFVAAYRIGNGASGNVGAGSLALAAGDPRIISATNPLPAQGGTDPETNDQIRRRAPQAFLTQERAVTMADYVQVAESDPRIDRAVASLRWTGSWYTVFIAAEPLGGGALPSAAASALTATVDRYRMAGLDLQLVSPQYVSLEIELEICVDPSYLQLDVEQALLAALGSGSQADGQCGLFAPDRFAFGQTVYLSPILAAARAVPGVVAVTTLTFQPQDLPATATYLDAGEIPLGSTQIARLANDPSFPDHGQLTLRMEGGR